MIARVLPPTFRGLTPGHIWYISPDISRALPPTLGNISPVQIRGTYIPPYPYVRVRPQRRTTRHMGGEGRTEKLFKGARS